MIAAISRSLTRVIFLSELPDKTALASLVLGSRYRPAHVFAGVAAAFAVHVGLAIAAGSLLALLPYRPLEIVVAVLFALGAVLLLRGRHENGSDEHTERHGREPGFWRVAWTGFAVIAVAEFGDLTQIATASLARRYHDPLSVGAGAVLALWAAAAVAGGRGLLKVIPLAGSPASPRSSCSPWLASAWRPPSPEPRLLPSAMLMTPSWLAWPQR